MKLFQDRKKKFVQIIRNKCFDSLNWANYKMMYSIEKRCSFYYLYATSKRLTHVHCRQYISIRNTHTRTHIPNNMQRYQKCKICVSGLLNHKFILGFFIMTEEKKETEKESGREKGRAKSENKESCINCLNIFLFFIHFYNETFFRLSSLIIC